ncbi:hypothetical protein LTR70_003454 [Exophiala xenobiotica]|uniref:Uncharacterized protein n=1 Tax=Lithohypha guttulata TaxID=1690604 RepID=A0ABR0KGB0_9EURO|nr:hypothetical protein LTR24_003002 [Lithohypha guttulata]KAK5322992.1 hypothetical protein LTR70_003454 [Exophiala xenobiotica]
MAGPKSIALAIILAAHGLAVGSASNNNRKPHMTVAASMLPRLAHPVQARQAPSTTTVQVPVATVCPQNGTPGSSSAFQLVSLPTVMSSNSTDSIVSASATMPDGSMTTFASRARRQEAAVAAQLAAALTLPGGQMAIPLLEGQSDAGQLVVGADGCQTLYSPTTTAVCSTIVSPAGLPPVTITDCDQYITFSSETLFSCSQTPTYSARPYSTTSARNETVTLDEDTFTSRPFATSSTNTMDGDSNDEMALTTSSMDPTATDFSSIGDEDQEENDTPEKRQIMFDHDGNAPVTTDLEIVAPSSSPTLRKREARSQRKKNRPYQGKGRAHQQKTKPHHLNNRPSTTDSGDIDPTVTPTSDVLAPVIPSSSISGMPSRPSNETTDGIFAAAAAATRIMPVPAMLQARYNREHVIQHHHQRQAEADEDTSDMPTAPMPSSAIDASLTTNGTNSTLSLQNKLAHFSPPQPTKYYAAPWEEIAQGGIPTYVKGITCYGGLPPAGECTTPDADGDTEPCECSVDDEVWSLTTLSETRVGTTVASFDGLVVVTVGSTTSTTSISFTSTLTTTSTYESVSVIHSTLKPGESASASVEPTITVEQTSIPSATMTLLPGDDASAGVFAGMPQDAASTLTATTTSDTPTDASATPEPEISILPYYGTTSAPDDDGYYGSAATIPGADAGGLATTVLETSVVATETVTVPGADASMAPAPAPTMKEKRDDVWPSDVWLAHADSAAGQAEAGAEGKEEKRGTGWPSDVWLAHLESIKTEAGGSEGSLGN